ncbi:MAG TPA: sulfatase [Actinomycetota bacterium]|nr:sulfatase [Actinomycetota bacterium]
MKTGRAMWRQAAAAALAFVVLVAGAVVSSGGTQRRSRPAISSPARFPHQPNIILILTDDQRWDSLSAMPNTRRLLGGHGMTFRNSFVTTPLCCPSRAGLLSGLYSRHTGVYSDVPPNGGASSFKDRSTLATWLKDGGYENGFVGKYLNDYREIGHHIPPGWDDWNAIVSQPAVSYYGFTVNENGRFVHYPPRRTLYSTSVLGGLATRFLRQARPPFFLHFAPIAPHGPAIPLPRDSHDPPQLFPARPPSFDEVDVSDKPWAELHSGLELEDVQEMDGLRRRTLETLRAVDREVANMAEVLSGRGLLDDTVIVFTSDNGYLLGEHRLMDQKIWPYEESIRVPLVMRIPWITRPANDWHLVLNIDVAPTLAELAGARPTSPMDGISLVPLLRGRSPPWRTAFVEEFLGRDQRFHGGPPGFSAIRTTRYLYVVYRTGWRELYDLRRDPYELDNLAGRPVARRLEANLSAQLRALIAERPR